MFYRLQFKCYRLFLLLLLAVFACCVAHKLIHIAVIHISILFLFLNELITEVLSVCVH